MPLAACDQRRALSSGGRPCQPPFVWQLGKRRTLLLPPRTPCDPIVALHELVRIGYRMTFLEVGKIRIWKPGKPDLQVDCSSGCPEVPVATALHLIHEMEKSKILSQEKLSRLTVPPSKMP